MSDGELKFERERKRKAEQDIDSILNMGSLDALHQKCREATVRKKQLSTSAETAKIKGDLLKLQEELKKLKRKKKRVKLEENAIQRNLNETMKKIHNQKKTIEQNIFDFVGRKTQII